jgi:hypothetical protein
MFLCPHPTLSCCGQSSASLHASLPQSLWPSPCSRFQGTKERLLPLAAACHQQLGLHEMKAAQIHPRMEIVSCCRVRGWHDGHHFSRAGLPKLGRTFMCMHLFCHHMAFFSLFTPSFSGNHGRHCQSWCGHECIEQRCKGDGFDNGVPMWKAPSHESAVETQCPTGCIRLTRGQKCFGGQREAQLPLWKRLPRTTNELR